MKKFENRRRMASDEEIAAIEKEVLAAIGEDEEASRDITANDLVEEAGKLEKYAEVVPDDKDIVMADEDEDEEAERQKVLAACDQLEKKINLAAESDEVKDEIKKAEKAIEDTEKKASVEEKGIEDEIGNEAFGEDPSVSTAVESDVDCETPKQTVSSNSEYIAKKCTAKLDRCAEILEKRGMKRIAFAIDKISDEIEASLKKQ